MGDRSENRDNEAHKRNPINDLYRLANIKRWHIVNIPTSQSVAEHSYFVTLLTMRLASAAGLPVGRAVHWALLHDAEEAWTGDIPGPMKKVINKNGIPYEEMMGDMYIDKVDKIILILVKIADIVEALKFLRVHGNGDHPQQVYSRLAQEMNGNVEMISTNWPNFDWDAMRKEILFFLEGLDETHIDDYL